ncbi:MAG: helix-turn-helix domain-containing protein [Candidatus Pristimantibacillus sp.]
MYRVLIVDDEPEIRLGLRLKVDWEGLDLYIVGEAANGIEALERLENEAVDIVLTDMNMPVMDGQSFLHACREHYPSLRLVVLTGYEDFNYARAAVRNHVRDYLLKPVTRQELSEALIKVTRELDEERKDLERTTSIERQLSQYYMEMKQHFIIHLVKGELEQERTVRERAKMFQLEEWEDRSVYFLTAGLRERATGSIAVERTPDKFRLPFELVCRETMESFTGSVLAFRDSSYPGLMHFILLEQELATGTFSDQLRKNVKTYIGFEPSVGTGQSVIGFAKWKDGYFSSLLSWNLAESDVQAESKGADEGYSTLPDDKIKVIRRLLIRGELEQFEMAIVSELQDALAVSMVYFVKVIFQLYLLLESIAYESRVTLNNREQLWLRPEMVLGLDTIMKAKTFLMSIASHIDRKLKHDAEDSEQSQIGAARQFIDDNYMYDLNLTMIAAKFNYNPSYFSELFKEKVGKTFIQYVTEVRMTYARRLLEDTTLGLWDIAEFTGFSNPSYFSSKFKKIFGVSPSDYRQQRPPEKNDNRLPKK